MLNARIIDPVKDTEWISPMVVQDKKTSELRSCVNLKILNDAYPYDIFPTTFTNEVLESLDGKEV